ncbi:uncharacterized protein LOC135826481 [Sycon ciliatum]|uniref:uncharacterized protein LOC135826481 n=1 Tax=Sycon ciliatum TaxID=27933 RepID=UPI0031F68BDB
MTFDYAISEQHEQGEHRSCNHVGGLHLDARICHLGNSKAHVDITGKMGEISTVGDSCKMRIHSLAVKTMLDKQLCTSADNCHLTCTSSYTRDYKVRGSFNGSVNSAVTLKKVVPMVDLKPTQFEMDDTAKVQCQPPCGKGSGGVELCIPSADANNPWKSRCVSQGYSNDEPEPGDYIYKIKLLDNTGLKASVVLRNLFRNVPLSGVRTNITKCVLINERFQRLKFRPWNPQKTRAEIHFTSEEVAAIRTHMASCSSKTAACSLNCTGGFFKYIDVHKRQYQEHLTSKAFVLRPMHIDTHPTDICKPCYVLHDCSFKMTLLPPNWLLSLYSLRFKEDSHAPYNFRLSND